MNPCAGTRKANKYLTDILVLFGKNGYNTTVHLTESVGDAGRFASKNSKGYDLVVAIGGDGTFNEVVEGVLKSGTDTQIGYIPAGSTNDFANSLKLSKNIMKAADDIMKGTAREIDIGSFNGRSFSYVASFGAFTEISYKTPQNAKNTLGYLAYAFEGIKDIANLKSKHLRFTADGTVIEDDFIFGAICNSTSVGGVLNLDPKTVDLSDGMFELLLIRLPKDLFELNEIVIALSSKKYKTKMITFMSASSITVETQENINWTLDGEYAEGEKIIKVKNLNKAIRIITHRDTAAVPDKGEK
ncbi:MAG: YegS/Rv2252/BmrU family lipid kinase [Ruminococcaceae bacterium]|nr:YegS/Rv2252/BmrU family lipid kinase [Oscillospiraceae bacterium]